MNTLTFVREVGPFDAMGMQTYLARSGPWQFLIVEDGGRWSASYRAISPKAPVSASSTIEGPFDDFKDAENAAAEMLRRLRRLS